MIFVASFVMQIFETESCIAILDAFPAVPGHSLLISKAPAVTVMDLSEQQAADLLKELPRLCRAVQKVICTDELKRCGRSPTMIMGEFLSMRSWPCVPWDARWHCCIFVMYPVSQCVVSA